MNANKWKTIPFWQILLQGQEQPVNVKELLKDDNDGNDDTRRYKTIINVLSSYHYAMFFMFQAYVSHHR